MAIPGQTVAAEECPTSLVLNVHKFSSADALTAQTYATCMSVPWLPTGDSLQGKLEACARKRPANAGKKLKKAFDWVDHIAGTFPGCEIRLQIRTRDGAAG
jgi:hypothetical protein